MKASGVVAFTDIGPNDKVQYIVLTKCRRYKCLTHYTRTEEGFFSVMYQWTANFETRTLTLDVTTNSRDCDGRTWREQELTCSFDDVRGAKYRSFRIPMWTLAACGQRDFTAEDTGY